MMPKGKLTNLRIEELSGVDKACQAPATVAIIKRAPEPDAVACAKCSGYVAKDAATCSSCGAAMEKRAPTTIAPVVAPAIGKSTQTSGSPHGGSHTENIMANENKTIAVPLTEAQYAHYSKLSATDGEVFLAKSASDRETIIKAALDADPIVYTTTNGMALRKSAGDIAVALAKQSDEQAKTIATQTAEIAKANDARQVEIYKARAKDELGYIAGTDDAKVDLLKAIDAYTTDQAKRDAMIGLHKSADAFAKDAGKARGHDGGAGGTNSNADVLKAAVVEFQKKNGIEHYEVAFVKATACDPKIRELYDAAQTERN